MPHPVPMASSFTYIAMFRFGRLTLTIAVAGIGIAAAGMLMDLPDDPKLLLTLGGLAISATLLALYLPLILTSKPGLRVDQDGLLFGGRPPIYQRTSAFVPWDAVAEIYIFRVRHWVFTATYVGLRGVREDVLPMSPSMPAGVAETIWHVPTAVVLASRPAYGWQLDKAALKAAVGYFASHVPVIDLSADAPLQRQLERKLPTVH